MTATAMPPTIPPRDALTRQLADAIRGGGPATADAAAGVQPALLRLARRALRRERRDHTLQATALVNECWLRLLADREPSFASRSEFYRAAATAMRRVLVDHARRRSSRKRGGGCARVPHAEPESESALDPLRLLAVDEAVRRLEREDPRAAKVVELRFFAGLEVDETAAAMGLSRRTVLREWAFARAVLASRLAGDEAWR